MDAISQVGFDSSQNAQFTNMLESFDQQLSLNGKSSQDQASSIIGAADSNRDGRVTAEELATEFDVSLEDAEALLDKFDKQGSSAGLDESELAAALQTLAGTPPPQQASGGNASEGGSSGGKEGASAAKGNEGASAAKDGGGGCGGGGDTAGVDLDQLLQLLDADGDGKVSAEELKEFEAKHGNGDGKLTSAELKDGLKAEAQEDGVDLSDDQLNELAGKVSDSQNITAQQVSTLFT